MFRVSIVFGGLAVTFLFVGSFEMWHLVWERGFNFRIYFTKLQFLN